MTSSSSSSSGDERDLRLQAVLLPYLLALEKGQAPDRRQLLTDHPDLADKLQEFFAGQDCLQGVWNPPPVEERGPIGDFHLLREIGRGGMGVVYEARQCGLNRQVALKVIMPERLGHPEVLQRFQREVLAAARLNHENIVTVYHADVTGPRPYLAMEYLPGIDLNRLVKQAGPVAVPQACSYILQAAAGLQHAHERGLVHRDVKPHNLMVTPSPLDPATSGPRLAPRVKILDLGLARLSLPGESGNELTRSGQVLGTPHFISPEQAEDSRLADVRSDLYSLGATLYFLLTGEVPFPIHNLMQPLARPRIEGPPSPAARRPDVPRGVDRVVRRLLAQDPAKRFQTARELIATLEQVLRDPGAEVLAPEPEPDEAGEVHVPTKAEWREVLAGLAAGVDGSSISLAPLVLAHPGGVQSLAIRSDGKLLLSGGRDQTLRLWELPSLREIRCLAENAGPVEQVCLTPKGKWAASCSLPLGSEEAVIPLWDLRICQQVRQLRGLAGPIRCVAIAPNGRRVAAGGDDATIRVWAVDQPGSPSFCLRGHTAAVTSLTFLSGGETLLSGSRDGTVRLWDIRSGTQKKTLAGQVGPIAAVAFGGTSRRLARAGHGVRLRQADGSATVLTGHQGEVLCVTFSAAGDRLLTGGTDRTVRLWRARDGAELDCWRGHINPVRAVVFSPDGRLAYSGSTDGTIRRWTLPGQQAQP